ncbi:MAG: ABC transporter ATP-binding protein [Deltaproteobacteria bacterium]|nr:ABC transporter ATP-binding protein [Deltaproteobacteria bacterium]
MDLLTVANLSKYFDLTPGLLGGWVRGKQLLKAVDRISFSIPEGTTLGLVGESGCGKSTTARLLTRLIPASGGEVCFQGTDILKLPQRQVRELRRHIQMVFQDPYSSLNPRMRVEDIVGRPLTLYFGINREHRLNRVAELLELVGLQPDHLYRYPHEFSGGQRQRICIARALAPQPKLLIADEPVSSLDVSVQAHVLNLFKKLQRELKLTMLFISHDLNVVQYLADFVAVMYAGKIVEVASTEELFNSPCHPYTKALIMSNPPPDPYFKRQKLPLRGEIALPVNPPAGCRFESRCPISVKRCKTIEPPLEEKRPMHRAACHEV